MGCHPGVDEPEALPDVVLACDLGNLPIRSESQAICHVRHLLGVNLDTGDEATQYSAKRLGDVWRVSVAPPKQPYVGGGYMVNIDANSGDLVTPSDSP